MKTMFLIEFRPGRGLIMEVMWCLLTPTYNISLETSYFSRFDYGHPWQPYLLTLTIDTSARVCLSMPPVTTSHESTVL